MGQNLGAGRPPKPAGAAVTRHKPTHGEVYLPAEGRTRPAPAPLIPLDALTPPAAELWTRLWATPEATQWGEADVPGLTRYVSLAVVPEVWLDSKLVGELRNLEDRYGCNPYARRVSKWFHDEPAESADAPTQPKLAARSRKLRVVDKAG